MYRALTLDFRLVSFDFASAQRLIDSRDPDVYPRNRLVFFRLQESVVNEIARLCVV